MPSAASSAAPNGVAPPCVLRPGCLPACQPAEHAGGDADQEFNAAERQPHSWSPCPGRAFRVRCGPDYATNHRKSASAHSIYEVFAVDGYCSEQKLPHLGRVVELPDDPGCADLGLPPYVLINYMIPNYAPGGMLSSRKTNGPGWNVVLYCRLSEAIRAAIRERRPVPSVELLRRFMDPVHGAALRAARLKCIFGATDVNEPGFNLVTKQLIQSYNFKPFLSKTASSFYLVPGKYFEIDVDIHTWGNAPLQGFHSIKHKISKMTVRAGVVIEAEDDADMPEQMLGSAYVSHLDPASASPFDPALTAFLSDERNFVPPLPKG